MHEKTGDAIGFSRDLSSFAFVPTLALSKSGMRVEVLNFLSAWRTSSPDQFTRFSIKTCKRIVKNRLNKKDNISNSSAIKLEPTASQSFPLHMQLRLLLMAERHIQIFKSSLLQVNLRSLLLNICIWLNCYRN